jgi:hypothetical protein
VKKPTKTVAKTPQNLENFGGFSGDFGGISSLLSLNLIWFFQNPSTVTHGGATVERG